MPFQAIFRIIKWVATGDAHTIMSEKHDTRPLMILFRLVVVLGALALIAAAGLLVALW